MQTLAIARRFCGPADSANGGYFAGRVAGLSHETLSVRLLAPPPLDTALRVEPGPDGARVAAPWVPDASLDGGDGRVRPEFIWAALDCPGWFAVAPDARAGVLGELSAQLERGVRVDEPCTVVGWRIASSGRKHESGTALYDAQGEPCARARAVWIEKRV